MSHTHPGGQAYPACWSGLLARVAAPSGDEGLLVTSVAPGAPLDHLVTRLRDAPPEFRQAAMGNLEEAVRANARALVELEGAHRGTETQAP